MSVKDPSSADFSSNDYLGLARSQELVKRINHGRYLVRRLGAREEADDYVREQ